MVIIMICPKCGTENDDDILFCENCDWRLDIPYTSRKETGERAKIIAPLSFIIGISALAMLWVQPIAGIVLGGVGLLLGSYSFNTSRAYEASTRNLFVALSAIGLLLAMIGFILGFSSL